MSQWQCNYTKFSSLTSTQIMYVYYSEQRQAETSGFSFFLSA